MIENGLWFLSTLSTAFRLIMFVYLKLNNLLFFFLLKFFLFFSGYLLLNR